MNRTHGNQCIEKLNCYVKVVLVGKAKVLFYKSILSKIANWAGKGQVPECICIR